MIDFDLSIIIIGNERAILEHKKGSDIWVLFMQDSEKSWRL